MRIYLSGPMTGIENYNAEAFNQAEKKLKDLMPGVEVVNPISISKIVEGEIENPTYGDYMSADISQMLKCDLVLCLEGFENSKGCEVEIYIAEKSGIPVFADITEITEQ